ncbi:MAG: hypothetical protein WBW69_20870 [Candidatus Korobacteraceae bacterium]
MALAAGLIAFVVQSGELGTADTQHRLQSAHSWWTAEPPVFPNEYPEFGVHGRGGKIQGWYGIGQSLLLFPFDVIGTYLERLPIFASYNGNDPSVRNIFVSYCINILINVLTALVCFRFLRQLKFDMRQAVAGVLALLLLTTHLHYTQNMMENNYIFLLTLTGISLQYEWLCTGNRKALLVGSAAFGLNLLTRITTAMDLVAGALFLLLVMWFDGERGRAMWDRCRSYIAVAFPVYLFFGLLDRVYQYYRFGSFFNTYMSVVAMEARLRDPSLPAGYPWETPFHVGFFGALFSPEKSVFLFDPLLMVMILIAVVGWKRFAPAVKAYVVMGFVLMLAYISFYARYTVWSGDFAWGDRYVSTSVQLAVLLAVPLLLRYRDVLGKAVWRVGVVIWAISGLIQIASLTFWLPLEIYQMETLGHPTFVVLQRLKNIAGFASGTMMDNYAMHWDPWDYVHITAWNFLPFLLKRVGAAPRWVVHVTLMLWMAGLAMLVATLSQLRRVLSAQVD